MRKLTDRQKRQTEAYFAWKIERDKKRGIETSRSESTESGRDHESNTERGPRHETNDLGHYTGGICNPSPIPRRMAKPNKK